MSEQNFRVIEYWMVNAGVKTPVTVTSSKAPAEVSIKESRAPKVPGSGKAYRLAKIAGKIVVTSHSASRSYVRLFPTSFSGVKSRTAEGRTQTLHSELTGQYFPDLPSVALQPSRLKHTYNRDELRTLAHAEANQREFDLLTAFGERGETIKLIKQLLEALKAPRETGLKFLARYMSRPKGKAYRNQAISDLTQAWLAYRYGFLPIVYSIEDAVKASVSAQNSVYQKVVKTDSQRTEPGGTPLKDDLINATVSFGWHQVDMRFKRYVTESSVLRYQLERIYSVADFERKKLAMNPALTMWELTPWSFVVDWLVQVGDFISALTPTCSSDSAATFSSKRVFSETWVVDHVVQNGKPGSDGFREIFLKAPQIGTPVKTTVIENYKRDVDTGSSKFTIPIGLQMNLKRALDSFALSWQILRPDLDKKKFPGFKR